MKKISEMTLEELRDYALQLEEKNTANTQLIADKDKAIGEYKDDIIALQRRNSALFLQVEQQVTKDLVEPKQEPTPDTKTVEDTAREHYKEYLKL